MRVEQSVWRPGSGWEHRGDQALAERAQLALVFAAPELMRQPGLLQQVSARLPRACIAACSTAGEIAGDQVLDGAMVVSAIEFAHTRVRGACVSLRECGSSLEAGARLARALRGEGLRHVLVLSDGLAVNGSELVTGLASELEPGVAVTGGLSGDGQRFGETLVALGSASASGQIVAVGLYGDRLGIGFGSLGGWDPFGPERRITRSAGNVLYELDGQSALALYKKYLGEYAEGLPATGLLFPLSLRGEHGGSGVVRTILGVDERQQSMTFAGDMPEGGFARLMKANFDRLIDGATGAAQASQQALREGPADLAILISCVGRKLVLQQRVEEEVDGVRQVLGPKPVFAGFYSYGEIAPFAPATRCELHNQTMTVTTLSER
ncbi:MAG: FIST signal transduction protein [Polyangiales bacterium]